MPEPQFEVVDAPQFEVVDAPDASKVGKYVEASKPWPTKFQRSVEAAGAASVQRPSFMRRGGLAPFTPEQRALEVETPSLTEFAANVLTNPTPGAENVLPRLGTEAKTAVSHLATPGQRLRGGAEAIGTAGEALSPLMGVAGIKAPFQAAKALATGTATSYGAKKATAALGGGEQAQELASEAGFWLPTGVGILRPRLGVGITPEEVVIRGGVAPPGVGPKTAEVRFPRGPQPKTGGPAGLEPPTIEGNAQPVPPPPASDLSAQLLAEHAIAEQNAAKIVNGIPITPPAPPSPSPPPMPEVSPQTVQAIGDQLEAIPPAQRAPAILDAHTQLAGALLQQGKVVGPDGKLHIVENEKQASTLAQKFINDEVERRDKAAIEQQKAQAETQKAATEQKPAGERKTRRQQAEELAKPAEPQFEVVDAEPPAVESAGAIPGVQPGPAGTREELAANIPETKPAPTAEDQGTVPAAPSPAVTAPFTKGSPVTFSRNFQVAKGGGKSEIVRAGTKAQVEYVNPDMKFARVKAEDGRVHSVPFKYLEAGAPEAEVRPPAAASKVGDNLRIMGVDHTLARSETYGGVRYDLFNAAKLKDPSGAVVVTDADSGNVVSTKRYPTYDAAEKEFNKAVAVEKGPPAAKEEVATPKSDEYVYHGASAAGADEIRKTGRITSGDFTSDLARAKAYAFNWNPDNPGAVFAVLKKDVPAMRAGEAGVPIAHEITQPAQLPKTAIPKVPSAESATISGSEISSQGGERAGSGLTTGSKRSPINPQQISDVRAAEWRAAAKSVNDIKHNPTGWLGVETDNGMVLVHPNENQIVRFEATDQRSGTALLRAKAEAQGYAIDNPVKAESGTPPSGELVVKPLFKKPSAAPKSDWQQAYEKALALQPENADALRKMSGEQLRAITEAKSAYEPKVGDLVEFQGKRWEVGFVNPGGSMRLQDPKTKERIIGWHSPSEVKPVAQPPLEIRGTQTTGYTVWDPARNVRMYTAGFNRELAEKYVAEHSEKPAETKPAVLESKAPKAETKKEPTYQITAADWDKTFATQYAYEADKAGFPDVHLTRNEVYAVRAEMEKEGARFDEITAIEKAKEIVAAKTTAPALELTAPPEDIGVQQFISDLPKHQQAYARAAYASLKENAPAAPKEAGKYGVPDIPIDADPQELGIPEEETGDVEWIDDSLRRMIAKQEGEKLVSASETGGKIEAEAGREQPAIQPARTPREAENLPGISEPARQGGNAPTPVPPGRVEEPQAAGEVQPGARPEDRELLERPAGREDAGLPTKRGRRTGAAAHPPAEREGREGTGVDGKPVTEPSPESPKEATETAAELRNQNNYRISDEYAAKIGTGGEKSKIAANLDALETLKTILKEGRERGTPAEMEALAKYVDFGGLASLLEHPYEREYAEHYQRLQKLLTPEELQEIKETLPNTHYTSMEMVDWHWRALQRLGFKGGRIGEFGMGIGNYYGRIPEKIAERSELYGVERNPLTGQMAKLLYPDATIVIKPFQQFVVPDNSLDLVLGNVPFQDFDVTDDPRYAKLKLNLHNYFIVKSLDKVRPGGLVAVITSRYTMDNVTTKGVRAREEMAKRADLLAAIRLPDSAFKRTAGTEVVADLLIFRKRAAGDILEKMPEWTKTGEIKVPELTKKVKKTYAWESDTKTFPAKTFLINKYFIEHPENVLGEHSQGGTMYRSGQYTVDAPADFTKALEGAMQKIPQKAFGKVYKGKAVVAAPPAADLAPEGMVFAPDNVKPNSFYLDEKGNVKIKQNGVAADLPPTLRTRQAIDHIKAAIGLREQLNRVWDVQLGSEDDDLVKSEIEKLDKSYDAYRSKYGPLHGPNLKEFFGDDPEYSNLLALENLDTETKTVAKSPVLSKRVLAPYNPLRELPSDPKAAMLKVLAARGYLDTKLMSELLKEPEEKIIARLGDANLIFQDPQTGNYFTADEYLSGDVRAKLQVAKDAADTNPAYQRNVQELEKVQPAPRTINQIQPNLGATWIPINLYKQFVNHLSNGGGYEVSRSLDGRWLVQGPAKEGKWSGGGISAHKLVQYALNQQQPTVWIKHSDGSRSVDAPKTAAAREKLAMIKEEFKTVVRRAPAATIDQLEKIYNDSFNSIHQREFDGEHLDFPGMSEEWRGKIRGYQKAFAWRVLQEGRGGLFHAPGLGKTLTMISAGQEAIRLKLSPKNLYVVPNTMVPQWREDFKRFYPNAHVLAVQDEDFTAQNRNKLMSRIATGDWDAVILAQSQYDMLPMAPEFEKEVIDGHLKEYRDVLDELNETAEKAKENKRTIKQIEKAIDKLESRLNVLNAIKKDNTITFDKMGFGMMFVDEAHAYKAMAVPTRMGNIKGISQRASKRAFALEMKANYMRKTHGGRGVILATGTPLTNTIGEVYILTKYLAPEILEQQGIRGFDDWAAQFASPVTTWEYAPDGVTFRPSTALSLFVNVRELQTQFRRFSEYLSTADMVRLAGVKLPEAHRKDVKVEITPTQEPLVQQIADRGEALFRNPPRTPEEMKEDNWLKLSSDARKISLDPRLYNPKAEDNPNSKVNQAIAIIKQTLHDTDTNRGAVVVFSDFFAHRDKAGKADFSIFEDIRKKLMKLGIPRSEIGIINEAGDSKEAKEAMYAGVRSGRIRVIMGSTDKLGLGVNIQDRLAAIFHLDQPWRPDQVEQREARGIRSGNMYALPEYGGKVMVYRLISEPREGKVKVYDPNAQVPFARILKKGEKPTPYEHVLDLGDDEELAYSFKHANEEDVKAQIAAGKVDELLKRIVTGGEVERDRPRAYDLQMYQQLERKALSQEQFLTGKFQGDTLEDTAGEVKLNSQMFALGKAMSTGNPDALRKLKLDHEMRTIELLQRNFDEERWQTERELSYLEQKLPEKQEIATRMEKNLEAWRGSTVELEAERTKQLEALGKQLDQAKARITPELEKERTALWKRFEKATVKDLVVKEWEEDQRFAPFHKIAALEKEYKTLEEAGVPPPVKFGDYPQLTTKEERTAFYKAHPDVREFIDKPITVGGIQTEVVEQHWKDYKGAESLKLAYELPTAHEGMWHLVPFDEKAGIYRTSAFLTSFATRARNMESNLRSMQWDIADSTSKIAKLQEDVKQRSPYADKLDAMQKEMHEIDVRLGRVDHHITDAPEDEQGVVDEEGEEEPAEAPKEAEQPESILTGESGTFEPAKLGEAAVKGFAAAHELWKGLTNPPSWTDYDAMTRHWTGAEQASNVELKKFTDDIKKRVPSKLRREAISNWIEADGDSELLRERADASGPKYKPGYEAALELTPEELKVAEEIKAHNDDTLRRAQAAGILDEGVENYVQHVWDKDPGGARKILAQINFKSLQTVPSFAKQRTIPTYFEGEQMGFKPVDKDVGFLTAVHDQAFNKAIASRAYIKSLMTGKAEDGRPLAVISRASAKELPLREGEENSAYLIKPNIRPPEEYVDYRPIDHPALRGWKWADKIWGERGEPDKNVIVQGDMLIHPEIYQRVKNNLSRSALQTWTARIGTHEFHPGQTALRVSSELKHIILSFSGFHQTTLGVHALEHKISPVNVPELDMENPEQRFLVDHGLMVADYSAMESFSEGVIGGGIVTKIPVIGPLYDQYRNYLFRSYLPRIKMAMAQAALARNRARYKGKLSDDQIGRLTADQSNAAFGHLNYKALGRNPTFQDSLRLMLLAPDFLEARARFVGQAGKPYGREQLAALVLGAAVIYTVARILNQVLGDDAHFDKPFSLVYSGREYSFRTIQGDIWHLATDTRQFVYSRLNPLLRTGMEAVTGRNEQGQKRELPATIEEYLRENVPIPAQPFARADNKTIQEKILQTLLKTVGINDKMARSATEEEASKIARERLPQMAASPEQMAKYYARRAAIEGLRNGDSGALDKGLEKGAIRPDEIASILRRSSGSPLYDKVHTFTYEQTKRVYDVAVRDHDTAAQEELLPLLLEKQNRLLGQGRFEEAGIAATQ